MTVEDDVTDECLVHFHVDSRVPRLAYSYMTHERSGNLEAFSNFVNELRLCT